MDDTSVTPPPEDLLARFEELSAWINQHAYPALARGPLGKEPAVVRIPELLSGLRRELAELRPIPIVLAGETGVGKSTLLNALLDSDLLPTGVVGAQTAAFITLQYASDWRVECTYISEAELEQIFKDAFTEDDSGQETNSREIIDRARAKVRTLLGIADGEPFPSIGDYPDGPPAPLRHIVANGKQLFAGEAEARRQLELHAKRQNWPITRFIDVWGPFEILRTGVVISDLPGSGDINRDRVRKAADVIRRAGQILIACEARGLKESLLTQLDVDGRLPHRLFSEREPFDIIIVGTSLDNKVPDPETSPEQLLELGLDPGSAAPHDIFRAIVARWKALVASQFREWLSRLGGGFIESRADREAQVARILERVDIIASSALDWKRFAKQRPPKVCTSIDQTGIPQLRTKISGLAEVQLASTRHQLSKRLHEFEAEVLDAIERSEALLGVNIEEILSAVQRSQQEMERIQDKYTAQVENLRVLVLDRFQQIQERLSLSIENAALKLARLAKSRVTQHLDGLHWASLRATVRHDGRWTTNAGRVVSLRDAMGGELTRLVPQAWARIADDQVKADIENSTVQLLGLFTGFIGEVKAIVETECHDEVSRRIMGALFQASLKKAQQEITIASSSVTALRKTTAVEMQQRVDQAIDESIVALCGDCKNDSGSGWRNRSLNRIEDGVHQLAETAKQQTLKIADDAVEEIESAIKRFCDVAVQEMAELASNLPIVLKEAVERSRLSTPQELITQFQHVCSAHPRLRDSPSQSDRVELRD